MAAMAADWEVRTTHRLAGGRALGIADVVDAIVESIDAELGDCEGSTLDAALAAAHSAVPVLRRLVLQDLRDKAAAEHVRLRDQPGGWDIAKHASVWIQRELDQTAIDEARGL